jgi:hypothetical protein
MPHEKSDGPLVSLLALTLLPLFLGCFALLSFTSNLSSPAANIIANGLDFEHISLISVSNPTFGTTLRTLLGNTSTAATELLPYVVILSNRSPNTIVAYTLSWKLKRDTTVELQKFVQAKYPDAVAGVPDTGAVSFADREDRPIDTGEQRVVALEFEFGPPYKNQYWKEWIHEVAAWQKQQYAAVHSVQVDLDAVIFSNGVLIGPDSSQLGMHFSAYVAAKQDLFRQIAASLDSGSTVEEAFRAIDSIAQAKPVDPSKDPWLFYRRLAAEEIEALRKRIGDPSSSLICKKAVRKQPFIVRRGSS